MSIELKQVAEQALLALEKSQPHPSNPVIGLTKQDFIDHEETIRQLRTALQQAEAQQPATGEPVVSRNPFASRCYTMSESHLSGHRLIVGFEKLGDAQDAHEWVARQGRGDFTRPAPSVLKDDQIAALVNKVRDIARMFHDHQSLRERIAIELVPALKASQEVKSNAERYLYLRDIRRRDSIVLSGPEAGVWCDAEDEDGTLLMLTEDDLDAAIDAAMRTKELELT